MKSCFVESEKKYPQIKFSSQNYYSLESNFFNWDGKVTIRYDNYFSIKFGKTFTLS